MRHIAWVTLGALSLAFLASCGTTKYVEVPVYQPPQMVQKQQPVVEDEDDEVALAKARRSNTRELLEQYEREGWKIDDAGRTMKVAILEHAVNKKKNGWSDITGNVSMCKSLNICKSEARTNALVEYVENISSQIEGLASKNMGNNAASTRPEEYDRFNKAFQQKFSAEVGQAMRYSYGMYRRLQQGSSFGAMQYKVVYLVDYGQIQQAAIKSLDASIKEAKLSAQFASSVRDIINSGVNFKQEEQNDTSK